MAVQWCLSGQLPRRFLLYVDAVELDSLPAKVPRYLKQFCQKCDLDVLEATFSNRRNALNSRAVRAVGA